MTRAAFGKPLLDGIAPVPVPAWNTAFDGVYPPGDQWYWRGEFLREISDEAIAVHAEYGPQMPTWKSTMHLYPIDGAASRIAERRDTAWAYRDAIWGGVFAGVDPDPANAGVIRDWVRAYSDAIKPYGMGGGYVNFAMDEPDRVRGMYGANYDRLARDQGAVRPGQRLPREPEHRARGLAAGRRRHSVTGRRAASRRPLPLVVALAGAEEPPGEPGHGDHRPDRHHQEENGQGRIADAPSTSSSYAPLHWPHGDA